MVIAIYTYIYNNIYIYKSWLRLAYTARLVPHAKVLSNQEETAIYFLGTATRFCWRDARWAAPNVLQCENMAFAMLRITVRNN